MEFEPPIKISVEKNENEKLELTTPWDCDLEDWERVFRTVLKWLTFSEEDINELFGRDEFGDKIKSE